MVRTNEKRGIDLPVFWCGDVTRTAWFCFGHCISLTGGSLVQVPHSPAVPASLTSALTLAALTHATRVLLIVTAQVAGCEEQMKARPTHLGSRSAVASTGDVRL